jgi:uncharacterized membrane protein YphA (DoxX/SURF4 family)
MKLHNIQILILRLAIAGLFLYEGIGKINDGWHGSPAPLMEDLTSFQKKATGLQLAYLDQVAIPYAGIWSRLITLGETATGISMLLGLFVRLSSVTAILMVLNLHAANGTLFSVRAFGSPWAGLILCSLLILFLARAGRWFGIDEMLAKTNPRGVFW